MAPGGRNMTPAACIPMNDPRKGSWKLLRGAKTVLSSTLPRAIETARHATGASREVPADSIFVEAPLPPPPVPFLKLRPGTWGVISRSFWFWGYAPAGVETHMQAWGRVRNITARLSDHAEKGDVLLCAHGYLNWMIDRRLKKEGWRLGRSATAPIITGPGVSMKRPVCAMALRRRRLRNRILSASRPRANLCSDASGASACYFSTY